MNTGEFFDKVQSLYPDWQYDHPRVLYSLIRLLKPEKAIECGTFMGYGACWMARALEENVRGHLYCIDNWRVPNPEWRKEPVKVTVENSLRALDLWHRVMLIEGDSAEVEWPRADFIYIDAHHSFLACLKDWHKAVETGATCICFDDALGTIGPRRVVDEEVMPHPDWEVARIPGGAGLAICMKTTVTDNAPCPDTQEVE